jgi:hypothetical protein
MALPALEHPMKRLLPFALGLALFGALFQSAPAQAGPTSDNPFGLGLELDGALWPGFIGGLSVSGKYWMDRVNAVDMNLGGDNGGISLGATYLWHNYSVFRRRDIPLYYGVGGYANVGGSYLGMGARAKIGVDWLFFHTPWEAFVEASPSLNLIGGLGFGVGLEGGARYYFF